MIQRSRVLRHLTTYAACLTMFFGLASFAAAQVVVVPATPVVGSSNPVSPEPRVARPTSNPCTVTLLSEQRFAGFSGFPMTYTPPAACPGPWAKVVLTADFTVTAGRQYDRTAFFYLGNINLYYGTTAEPRRALSPSWHIERDVTDLSSLFHAAQTGVAEIDNEVDSTYTGVIYANVALQFYPANSRNPAAPVPDALLPLSSTNGPGAVNVTTDVVKMTATFPRNVEKVYLDVIAESQSNDEQWFLCVPNDQTGALASCGNTGFRETEITIDGQPAGVAPVYPWIYTGGLDPYLWEPITGLQTLNFMPYRVDLTPFAGLLSNGAPHTVAVSVYNANQYFLVAGNLLLYTDPYQATVTGGVTSNSLSAAPKPVITENLLSDGHGTTTGTVSVSSNRTFHVTGYVNTSHGQTTTTVAQRVNFVNSQTVDVNANTYNPDIQNLTQFSTVLSETTTQTGSQVVRETKAVEFPLSLNYSYVVNSDGSQTQVVTSDQKYLSIDGLGSVGFNLGEKTVYEEVNSTDTIQITPAGSIAAPGVGQSTATYRSTDSAGNCYSQTLTAANQVLTGVANGVLCHGFYR